MSAYKIEGPLLPAKFHLDRCNVSPLRGKNPKIGQWVKTILAELAFGQILPVMNDDDDDDMCRSVSLQFLEFREMERSDR